MTKSELESILNVLDAEAERILEGCSGESVLYGGMQDGFDEPGAAEDEQQEDDLVYHIVSLTLMFYLVSVLLSRVVVKAKRIISIGID